MDIGLAPLPLTLESRFTELDRPVLLSGVQALVRALLEQARLDREAGLRTGGLVSGYRGSPLGGVDQEMWRREKLLTAAGIRFQPGLNEDLAATMLWGSQQVDFFPGKRVQGVFGMWYGKGPGVDRTGDAFRCANTMGTSKHGGVLAVSGDDHVAHSSVFPHSTEGIFESVNIPILQPADVADIIDLALAGIAMSRFSGLWVALKTIAETAEQHGMAVVPRAAQLRHPRPPAAAARAQHRLRTWRGRRSGRSSSAGSCRSGCPPPAPGRAPTGWTAWSPAGRRPRSASSPSARRTTTSCTRCAASAWSGIPRWRSTRSP